MAYTVYILQDDLGRLYKDMTRDLDRRLREHRTGRTHTTSKMSNLSVAHAEVFADITSARKREKYLKTAAGRRYIKFNLGL